MDTKRNNTSNIRRIREVVGLNQTTFANALDIPRTTLINYEKGMALPSDLLLKLKEKWGVSIDWLLTGEGEMFLPGKDPRKPQEAKSDTVSLLEAAPEAPKQAAVPLPTGPEPPKRIRRISMELQGLADELDVGGPVPARLRPLVRRVARLDDEDLAKTTAYVDDLLQKVKYAQGEESAGEPADPGPAEAGIA